MQTIQITSRNTKNAEALFAFITRAALLLGNNHLELGYTAALMLNNILYKAETTKQKIKFYRAIVESEKNTELLEGIDKFLTIEKTFVQNKHPNKELFRAYKQMENTILKMYKEWVDANNEMLKNLGLANFEPLMQSNVFEAYGILLDDAPKTAPENLFLHKANVFTFKTKCMQNKKPIWFFPNQFYSLTSLENFDAIPQEYLPKIKENYVELCDVDGLNLLTTLDIQNIKKQFELELINSCEALQQWANDCYNNNGEGNLLNSLKNIKSHIDTAVKNNELLQRVATLSNSQHPIKLFAGEATYEDLIYFYKCDDDINEALEQELLDWYKEQKPFKIPVIVLCVTANISTSTDATSININEEKVEEQNEIGTKKYLDI